MCSVHICFFKQDLDTLYDWSSVWICVSASWVLCLCCWISLMCLLLYFYKNLYLKFCIYVFVFVIEVVWICVCASWAGILIAVECLCRLHQDWLTGKRWSAYIQCRPRRNVYLAVGFLSVWIVFLIVFVFGSQANVGPHTWTPKKCVSVGCIWNCNWRQTLVRIHRPRRNVYLSVGFLSTSKPNTSKVMPGDSFFQSFHQKQKNQTKQKNLEFWKSWWNLSLQFFSIIVAVWYNTSQLWIVAKFLFVFVLQYIQSFHAEWQFNSKHIGAHNVCNELQKCALHYKISNVLYLYLDHAMQYVCRECNEVQLCVALRNLKCLPTGLDSF